MNFLKPTPLKLIMAIVMIGLTYLIPVQVLICDTSTAIPTCGFEIFHGFGFPSFWTPTSIRGEVAEYRFNFLNAVLTAVLFYGISCLFVSVIFSKRKSTGNPTV